MATTKKDVFAAVAAQEELLSAACAATAHWVPDAEAELHALAAAHLADVGVARLAPEHVAHGARHACARR